MPNADRKQLIPTRQEIKTTPEQKRQKVARALTEATLFLERLTQQEGLAPKLRRRCEWALKAVRDAMTESLDRGKTTYTVEVRDESNRLKTLPDGTPARRDEGIPIDELVRIIEEASKSTPEQEAALREVAAILRGHSKNYFQYHYGKKADKLSPKEQEHQHIFTEYEARLVSLDPQYRELLREKYHDELPADFDKWSELDQNYHLAALAERNRELLVMPSEEEKEEEEEAEAPRLPRPERLDAKAYLVDITEIAKRMAWTKAEEMLMEKFRRASWLKRAWMGLTEYRDRIKFYKEALEEIRRDNNLLKAIEGRLLGQKESGRPPAKKEDYYVILDKIVEQFDREIADVKSELGEEILDDRNISAAAAELFYRHTQGKWDNLGEQFRGLTGRDAVELFVKEKIAPLLLGKKWGGEGREGKAKGLLYASNFWNLAEQYKEFIREKTEEFVREHGSDQRENIVQHLRGMMNLDLQLGLKERDLANNKPKGFLSLCERLIDRFESNRLLGKVVANPFTLGIVAGVGGGILGRTIGRWSVTAGLVTAGAAMPFLAPLLAGAIVGGVFRYYKRRKDIKYDIAQERRHETLGEKGSAILDKGDFRYTLRDFADVQNALLALLKKGADALTEDDRREIANVLARLSLGKELNLDLFRLDKKSGRRYGTTEVAMTDLKLALKVVCQRFGLTDEALRPLVEEEAKKLRAEINMKEENIKRFQRLESAKSGLRGALIGIGAGILGQQIFYMGGRLLGFDYFKTHGTTFEKIMAARERGGDGGIATTVATSETLTGGGGGGSVLERYEVDIEIPGTGTHTVVGIPEGFQFRPSGDHFEFLNPKGEKIGDVFLNSDGSIRGDSAELLQKAGYTLEHHAKTITIDPLKQLEDKLGIHERVDWHDEPGKRYSAFFKKLIEFEGKQQMLYLESGPDGQIYINADSIVKNVIKNLEGAFEEFGTNPDGSVDSKLEHLRNQLLEWWKAGELGKHLQAVIIPTEEANQKGLSILTEGTMEEGRFRVALPKEISDLFKNPENLRYGEHPVRYIELRIGGHTIATTVGEDMRPTEIPIYHPEIIPGAIPPSPEAIPPSEKPYDWTVPLVPPARKVYKREPPEVTPVPYYGYGGGREFGWLDISDHEKRRSPSLRGNADVELNEQEEVEWYLNQQPADYLKELRELNQQVGSPMERKCRVAVCIPAYKEGTVIEKTLLEYSEQLDSKGRPLNPELFELIIFDNYPVGAEADETARVVREFQQRYPGVRVRYVQKAFPKNEATIGNIRKYVNDLALLRSYERGDMGEEFILVSNDADAEGIDPLYIQRIIEAFDKNPKLDAIAGKTDYPKESFQRLPLLHASERLWQYVEKIRRWKFDKMPELIGRNSAFRAKTYAAVGGYNPQNRLGEDIEMGFLIKTARKEGAKDRIKYLNAVRLLSNPRRAILKMFAGNKLVEQYWDFDEYLEVRGMKWEELTKQQQVRERLRYNRERFQMEANALYQYYAKMLWIPKSEINRYFKRAMDFLGVQYRMEGDNVIVINTEKLERGLKNYQSGSTESYLRWLAKRRS